MTSANFEIHLQNFEHDKKWVLCLKADTTKAESSYHASYDLVLSISKIFLDPSHNGHIRDPSRQRA